MARPEGAGVARETPSRAQPVMSGLKKCEAGEVILARFRAPPVANS
jgi:hypothetical protein